MMDQRGRKPTDADYGLGEHTIDAVPPIFNSNILQYGSKLEPSYGSAAAGG